MSNFQMPSSRYVLPSFIEQSAQGTKETNPYSKLFEERIICSFWRAWTQTATSPCTSTRQVALLPR